MGCIIIEPDLSEVVAIGYNGPPVGVDNNSCRGEIGSCGCVHSESNALIKLRSKSKNLVMLSTVTPCEHCSGLILNSQRIAGIIYGGHYRDPTGSNLIKSQGILMAHMNNDVLNKNPPGENPWGIKDD